MLRKESILEIYRSLHSVIESEVGYDPDALSCQINVSGKNQRWKFYNIDELQRGLPPTAGIKHFDMLIGCNFAAYDASTPLFSLYASLDEEDRMMFISSSGSSDVHAQELVIKLESILVEQYKHKPSESHAAESQGDTSKKFYKSPVFWAAAIVIVTALLWVIDRFILGK